MKSPTISPSLLALAIRIISISVGPPKVAKASKSMSLSCVIVAGIIALPSPMQTQLKTFGAWIQYIL
jgi:hypothetical protein